MLMSTNTFSMGRLKPKEEEGAGKMNYASSLPSLMLPPGLVIRSHQQEEKDHEEEYLYRFYSMEDKKIGGVKNDKCRLLPWEKDVLLPTEARCVGSTHGWLAYVIPLNNASPAICLFKHPPLSSHDFFSPSSMVRLPPIDTLPHVTAVRTQKGASSSSYYGIKAAASRDHHHHAFSSGPPSPVTRNYCLANSEYRVRHRAYSSELVSEEIIHKLVLSSQPTTSSKNSCIAMAMFDMQFQLAFCRLENDNYTYAPCRSPWTSLDPTKYGRYLDVIYSHNDQLFYALTSANTGDDGCYHRILECWDLTDPDSPPKRTAVIDARVHQQLSQPEEILRDSQCYEEHAYLVESEGELLLVDRFVDFTFRLDDNVRVANFVEFNPYRTLRFDVYKLDSSRENWEPLKCLGDRALFVGLNHSFSVSTRGHSPQLIESNAIYFTDETSALSNTDHSGGGHDMGIFHLADNNITQHFPWNVGEPIHPPPVWVAPLPNTN